MRPTRLEEVTGGGAADGRAPRSRWPDLIVVAMAVAWVGLMGHLMIAPVWDELGLVPLEAHGGLGGYLARIWTSFGLFRPLPLTVLGLLQAALGDPAWMWRAFRLRS